MKRFFLSFYFYIRLFLIFFNAYFKLLTKRYSWEEYVRYSKKVLELVKEFGVRVVIEGEENLREVVSPVVIVSNHMSSLETLIFGYIIGRFFKLSFVVKDSLLRYPIFGRLMKFLDPIAVSRKKPRKDFEVVLKKAKELLNKKVSVVVFPQGTRSKKIEEKNFSKLGIKLAEIFKVDILPICVKTDFLELGDLIRDMGAINLSNDVYIRIFPPIKFQQIRKETHQQIMELFKETLKKWQIFKLFVVLNFFFIF